MEPISDDHPDVLEIVEKFSALPDAIASDFARSYQIYESNPDDPFNSRLLVRAVASYIEGQMAAIREQLIFHHHLWTNSDMNEFVPRTAKLAKKLKLDFKVGDYFRLVGKRLKKDMNRRIANVVDENLCVEETIKFLFKVHGQVFGHTITPTNEADGWQMLIDVKQKRNQLTHPKCAADLNVTPEQVHNAMTIFLWIKGYLDSIREIEAEKWAVLYEEFIEE